MEGGWDSTLMLGWPSSPALETLTISVVPASRSRTKTSTVPFVSPGTRFEELEANATNRPSAEIAGTVAPWFAWAPEDEMLTRSVTPFWRSRTKMSLNPFVSPATRSSLPDWKATKRPLPEIAGLRQKLDVEADPAGVTLMLTVVLVW